MSESSRRRPLRKWLGRLALVVFSLVAIAFAWFFWATKVSPTTVALVNYPDFQAARIAAADDTWAMRVERVRMDEILRAADADLVLVFGRGLSLDDAQRAALREVASRTEILIESSTDPASDVTNLGGQWLDRVSAYLGAGGDTNFANLLRYVRAEIDGKRIAAPPAGEPEPVPMDVLFHLQDAQRFTSVADFEAFAEAEQLWQPGAKKIALITSVPGPFNANREHVDATIRAVEARGHAVYPMAAVLKRLEWLQAIEPDAVLFMPHGRLTLDQGKEAVDWLKQQNIPVLAPVAVFQNVDDWRADQQGFAGGLLTLSVTLPELDGAIAPYAIAALEPNDAGYEIFKAQPKRLDRQMDLLDGYLKLKAMPNADKRIAIVYFKGPGQAALTAAELEVAPSLHRTLLALRDAGYELGDLPDDFHAFHARILEQGRVLAPYAGGDQSAFFESGDPVRVSAAQLAKWCERSGIEATCAKVDAQFGPAPGRYMVNANGELAVARVTFGNVTVLPQPLAGVGGDTFKVVHGTSKAPPHPYIAAYLWARHGFGADALVHFGTHGSLEFTPSKQVALTERDWADALVGGLPHAYVYTMANVGEAMIAKRRSYAATVSHLTPPIRGDAAAEAVRALRAALDSAAQSDGAVRAEAQAQARALAAAQGLIEDLKLPDSAWTPEQWQDLSNLVERLAAERITIGLQTLGKGYRDASRREMVGLALRTPLAEALALRAELNGSDVDPRSDRRRFRLRYESTADALIADVLGGRTATEALAARLGKDWTLAAAEAARKRLKDRAAPTDAELIRGFIAMGQATESSDQSMATTAAGAATEQQIDTWIVTALASEADLEFLRSLESDKSFERASGTLDPDQLARARQVARSIPPMAAALDVATQDHISGLLRAMQQPETRKRVLALLDDPNLQARVDAERERQLTALRESLAADADLPRRDPSKLSDAQIAAALSVLDRIDQRPAVATGSLQALADAEARAGYRRALEAEQYARDQRRDDLARSMVIVWDTLASAQQLQAALIASPQAEIASLINSLGGGYVSPSVGGDPVSVPAALPTGRNLYAVDAEKTPSAAAWRVGQRMAEQLISSHVDRHGAPPAKVAFTFWPGDFIQTEGALLAQVFWLLGVEPIRDAFGRVVATRLVPTEQLGRPRVDVVIQTAGQFRDIAASRLTLIEQAVAMAAAAGDNPVSDSVGAVESALKAQGVAPAQAKRLSTARVFGGANGAYGTNIMGLVESGDRWQAEGDLAEVYLNNMGAQYGSSERWMDYQAGLFEAVLTGTDALVQPRESNTWGALSLDHVYEFMGGLSLATRSVNGRDADAYFADFRNSSRARMSSLEETLAIETRATLLNPNYLQGLRNGGASSAEVIAETLRNSYGWEATRPEALDQRFWDQTYATLIEDVNGLGLKQWLDATNPYADQEMTAVLLETARKGFWDASDAQLSELATRHADNVKAFGTSCSSFVCGNTALRGFIEARLSAEAAQVYAAQIDRSVLGEGGGQAITLEQVQPGQPPARADVAASEGELADAKAAEGNRQVDDPAGGESSHSESAIPWLLIVGGLVIVLLLGGLLARRGRGMPTP